MDKIYHNFDKIYRNFDEMIGVLSESLQSSDNNPLSDNVNFRLPDGRYIKAWRVIAKESIMEGDDSPHFVVTALPKVPEKKIKKKPRRLTQIDWKDASIFSVFKAAEGGPGYGALDFLKDAGIPARRCSSIYVGHLGIMVPKKYQKKAAKILYR